MSDQIKDFYEGRCIRAYQFLGCHRAERGFRFMIWAPNARFVTVAGDFNGWSYTLKNGEQIVVSRMYSEELRRKLGVK